MKTSSPCIISVVVASLLAACGGANGSAGADGCRPAQSARPYLQVANAGASVSLKDVASCQDSPGVSYRWTLLSKPRDSQASLVMPSIRTPAISIDTPGLYLFRMEETGAATAQRTLAVVAQAAGENPAIEEHALLTAGSMPKFEFSIKPTLNNQGIAYANGYFYVGYDITNGNGMVERYSAAGVLDSSFGREPITTRHTAELAYRAADNRLYAVSGGATDRTYVYRLTENGKSVDEVLDFSAYGTSGLIAIDNRNDLLLLVTSPTSGDKGDPAFKLIDLKDGRSVLLQFSIPNHGVPQGVEIVDGIVYLYTNNRITLLDLSGTIIGRKDLDIAGESQGLTLVTQAGKKFLAVGYNQPGRIYSLSPK